MKKTESKKSRDTVPLNLIVASISASFFHHFYKKCKITHLWTCIYVCETNKIQTCWNIQIQLLQFEISSSAELLAGKLYIEDFILVKIYGWPTHW